MPEALLLPPCSVSRPMDEARAEGKLVGLVEAEGRALLPALLPAHLCPYLRYSDRHPGTRTSYEGLQSP